MKRTCLSLLLAAGSILSLAAQSTKTGTVTTRDGKTYTYEKNRTPNGDGTATTTGTITGPDGQQGVYNGTARRTENGVESGGTFTRPDGRESTYSGSTVRNPDGTFTRNRTHTGVEGRTRTSQANGTRQSGTRTITGPNGKSRTRSWNRAGAR